MPLQIKCVPLEIQPGRPDINFAQALKELKLAQAQGVDLLILPQGCLAGQLLGSLDQEEDFLKDCLSYGQELIAATGTTALLFGNLTYARVIGRSRRGLQAYPTLCLAQEGKLLLTRALAPDLELEEQPTVAELSLGTTKLRLGCTLSQQVENDLPQLVEQGAELLVELDATAYQLQSEEKIRSRLEQQSRLSGLPLLYLNQGGLQNTGKNLQVFPGTCLAYAQGQLLGATEPLSLQPLRCSYDQGQLSTLATPVPTLREEAALYRCLRYGGQKFLQQCGIRKMTIGLSGGIDSAVTAALYTDILGPENVLLLNLPSVYNSSTTRDLAQELAYNLGANYGVVPIQESYEHTVAQLEGLELHRKDVLQAPLQLSGLVKENIQARDRGARVIAAAAAAFGGAFSCNSNKTEMTIGYCTFYGDLAGALALIGDLWKDQVYALGRYLNEEIFHREVIPKEIFTIRPSAELSSAQTVGQGGDPLHYDYHNRLFQRLLESSPRVTPATILRWYQAGTLAKNLDCRADLIEAYFPTPQALIEDLERWWRLFTGFSVAKRIQAPPILSLSSRPYGNPFPESQLQPYFSREYQKLKAELLK